MSATLGDVDEIAATLQRQTGNTVSRVMNAPRPVPLSYEYVKTPIEATVELALRAGEGPMYLVHFSQDAALSTASALASYGVATKAQREAVKEAMKGTAFTTAFGKTLKRLLGFGVGVHHAGMLPRYRLLVEKLAQQGLLPVICGTDTLGVGINVPIHTVVFTQLTKFDGYKMRRLRSREFHQIAGRAGRSGFDSEGRVLAEAPEHEIENYKAMVKAGGDEKKLRRIKKKKAPEGFVNWSEQTFDHLIESQPEKLTPRLRITHSMVLSVVEQGGDARARVEALINDSMQTPEEKIKLSQRADEVFATLIDADVVERRKAEDGVVTRLLPAHRGRALGLIQNDGPAAAEIQKTGQLLGVGVTRQPRGAAADIQCQRRPGEKAARLALTEEGERQRHSRPETELAPAGVQKALTLAGRVYLCDHLSSLTIFLNSRPRTSKLG